MVVWGRAAEADDIFYVKMCYFEPVFRCTHDYRNQFDMKWKKNQFEVS